MEQRFDLLGQISELIDAWCERRELRALALLLPAWTGNSGLTDGWAAVLEALQDVRSLGGMPEPEELVIEQAIIAVERMVSRR